MPEVRTAYVSVADRAGREDARGPAHVRVRAVRLRRDRRRPIQLNIVLSSSRAVVSGHRASARRLSVDGFGGVLLRINDRNYHDRISFLNFSSGNYCRFFAAERTFYLCVHS